MDPSSTRIAPAHEGIREGKWTRPGSRVPSSQIAPMPEYAPTM